MDVGVALQAAYHDGNLYEPSVLAVDETVILGQIALAGRQALALSLEAAIYEKDVVDAIIGKAYREGQVIKTLVK